jgi:hypothetical protein
MPSNFLMEQKGGIRMGAKKSKGKGGHQNYWSKKIVTAFIELCAVWVVGWNRCWP